MKTIFNINDYSEIVNRINQLTPLSQPLWGKMSVAQMLKHLQEPLKVSIGDLILKKELIGILFGGIAKKQIINEKPFKRNLPTSKAFIVTDQKDFEIEKINTFALLKKLHEGGPEIFTKNNHPFFGKLTQKEWEMLTMKHVDHHLNQFGV